MAETQDVTNQVIREIHIALTALTNRRLKARKNQTRVVSLLRKYFDIPFDITTDGIKGIQTEHDVPEEWEGTELPVRVLEARQTAIDAYMKETQKIAIIPKDELLTEDDLPKLIEKGELADANQIGLGDIIHKLHFVFPMASDAKPLVDGNDGGPEVTE